MSPQPDSHDLVNSSLGGQTLKSTGIGAVFGLGSGIVHGLWLSTPTKQMFKHSLLRSAQFAGLSAIFQSSAIYTAQLRHKNDGFNLAVGGALTGFIAGFSRGNGRHAVAFAALFGLVSFAAASAEDSIRAKQAKPLETRYERPDFFAVPKHDPFAKRMNEISKE